MKITALLEAVGQEFPEKLSVWVLGVKPGKDLEELLRLIAPTAQLVVVTEFDENGIRSVPADVLIEVGTKIGVTHIEAWPRMDDALARAVSAAGDGVPVIVSGSFHTVAAAGRRTRRADSPG